MTDKPQHPYAPGHRVRLTSDFIRIAGRLTHSARQWWIVERCSCGLCQQGVFVATDEPNPTDPSLRRHFLVDNIERDEVVVEMRKGA